MEVSAKVCGDFWKRKWLLKEVLKVSELGKALDWLVRLFDTCNAQGKVLEDWENACIVPLEQRLM